MCRAGAGALFLTGGRVRSQRYLKAACTGVQVASLYVAGHTCEHVCRVGGGRWNQHLLPASQIILFVLFTENFQQKWMLYSLMIPKILDTEFQTYLYVCMCVYIWK